MSSKIKDKELKWKENVNKAKEIIGNRKINQMLVAKLAMEVCEISWGGTSFENKFTLKRFADEVGVNYKRISAWVAVKRNVFDKLPDNKKEISFVKMCLIASQVSRDASYKYVEDVYDKVTGENSYELKYIRYLHYIRSFYSNLLNQNASLKVSDKANQEAYFYLTQSAKIIKRNRPNIKAVDNNLCRTVYRKDYSAADALGIIRNKSPNTLAVKDDSGKEILLTQKDQKILKFFIKNKKSFSPTEIGEKVGLLDKKIASPWAYRSIAKLHSLGYLYRNNNGHYKYVRIAK